MDITWNNCYMCHWLDSHKDIFNNPTVVLNRKKYPFPNSEELKKGTSYAIKHFFKK